MPESTAVLYLNEIDLSDKYPYIEPAGCKATTAIL
jgi:hypothetical protein